MHSDEDVALLIFGMMAFFVMAMSTMAISTMSTMAMMTSFAVMVATAMPVVAEVPDTLHFRALVVAFEVTMLACLVARHDLIQLLALATNHHHWFWAVAVAAAVTLSAL